MKFVKKIFENSSEFNDIQLTKEDIMSLSYMYEPNYALVYQMGKVGSTALCRSFDKSNIKYSHCQWLREDTFEILKWKERIRAKGEDYNFRVSTYNYYKNIRFHLIELNLREVVKVITLFREPIAQFLSAFFHGGASKNFILEKYGAFKNDTVIQYIIDSCKWVLDHEHETLSILAKNKKNYPHNYLFIWYLLCNPLNWFNDELFYHFHIDVYSEPFEQQGWIILDNRILVIKFESLGEITDKVIGGFVQRPNFELIWANAARDKDYAELYNSVKSEIKFEKEWLDFVYDSRYSKHFYSSNEINSFYRKWEM